ncbi:protein adenylyltransferase SelO [Lichenicoccus sp.]|uniref:protein adenylyltransferase SelO n=1 Tax=Lichenicoccus sp. TaxID=2781899 RepID=UPI003D108371
MLDELAFDNSYARLPESFYARLPPTPVAAPRLLRLNAALARTLGLDPDALAAPEGVAMLAGNLVPARAEPLAMAYAGHQFGNWVPRLGDGRALLLGELVGVDGIRRDLQLKGAGRTPFSRAGDGRAAVGPALREYIVSEAMAALGVPTARALAVVATGEAVLRETRQHGAVLARVARSHVRIGTFQYFRGTGDVDGLRALADYVIARHYPEASSYRALLDAVIAATARLVAAWQMVGFIHGVMNTDNMSIAGETIDYGPCAFMDSYDPATVYSSIDRGGRYAYGNQPAIAHWNLTRLAEAILPLLGETPDAALAEARAALDAFAPAFGAAWLAGMRRKLGLEIEAPGDVDLVQSLLALMAGNAADFTLTFRRLADAAAFGAEQDEPVRALFIDPTAFDAWAVQWRARLGEEGGRSEARAQAMRAVNPAFIARNHRVQAALAAVENGFDLAPLEELLGVLARPYEDQPGMEAYAAPPRPEEVVRATFCGT